MSNISESLSESTELGLAMLSSSVNAITVHTLENRLATAQICASTYAYARTVKSVFELLLWSYGLLRDVHSTAAALHLIS